MMSLKIQLLSFTFSIIYGLLVGVFYNIFIKQFKGLNKKYTILNNFLFVTDVVLLFFICIYHINEGVIHIYFLLTYVFSFLISKKICKHLQKKCKNNA